MVKPDGVQRGLIGEVISRIERRGLKIVAMRMNRMSLDSAKKHYAEHTQKIFFQLSDQFHNFRAIGFDRG